MIQGMLMQNQGMQPIVMKAEKSFKGRKVKIYLNLSNPFMFN